MPDDALTSPQPLLLGLLMAGPRHPYALYRDFDRVLGRVWGIGQSQFYAYLKRLVPAGLATVQTETQAHRPPRQVYAITPAGRDLFLAWLRQPTPHRRQLRLELLARIYFFRRLALPGLAQLLADQRAVLAPRVESLQRQIAAADDDFWATVLRFRLNETEAVLRWLEDYQASQDLAAPNSS